MHIITGATGHIGSTVAETLLDKGEKVLILTRSEEKGEEWKKKGAEFAVVDVNDTQALHKVFQRGKRIFLLNPPASIDTDTIKEEQRSVNSMLSALKKTPIEKIVAESSYGAHPGEGCGDLNVLYNMELGLKQLDIPVSIIRGAYYMSNWDMQVASAKSRGIVETLYPVGFKIPMVAPHDIGEYAAKLLMEPADKTGLYFVEGPEPYSCAEVAEALGEVLQKRVEAVETPESEWVPSLKKMGFSEPAAQSMAKVTRFTLDSNFEMADAPHRGSTTLKNYFEKLVRTGKSHKTPSMSMG